MQNQNDCKIEEIEELKNMCPWQCHDEHIDVEKTFDKVNKQDIEGIIHWT